jgi:hypothetical protein
MSGSIPKQFERLLRDPKGASVADDFAGIGLGPSITRSMAGDFSCSG